ncbi:MAG: DUF4347 domain-containing protein [Parachlamydiaceae bacterium]|nr:DUF4347 domain-containing protein [Parachlamydiaceae bacterium]
MSVSLNTLTEPNELYLAELKSQGGISLQKGGKQWQLQSFEGRKFLKLDPKDKREIVLYLTATHNSDFNQAFSLKKEFTMLNHLYQLSTQYSVKFKVVGSYNDIQREIDEASQIGNVKTVWITAHGKPDYMHLGKKSWISNRTDSSIIKRVFAGLTDRKAKIILLSCETGAEKLDGSDNIAQRFANITGKTVLAPSKEIPIRAITIQSLNPFHLKFGSLKNIAFNPKNATFSKIGKVANSAFNSVVDFFKKLLAKFVI